MTFQYFMVNALGFALQLVSAMFVVLRPFGGKRYRVPRRVLLIALAVYGAAASFAFPLVTYYVDVIDAALLGNFYLLAVALVFAVGYFCVVDDKPIRKVLAFVFGIVYAAVQYSVVNLLLPLVAPSNELQSKDPYSTWGTGLYAVTTAVMLPLMVLFQEKAFRRYLEVIDVRQTRRDTVVMVAASVVYLCLMMSQMSILQAHYVEAAWMATSIGLLLTAAFGLFLYYYYHLALVREQEVVNRINSEVFLEKPFKHEDVEEALQRTARPHELRRGVSVSAGNATRFVYLDEIATCESAGHMVTVRPMDGGVLSFRQALSELRRSLDARFIDVTRGVVVNADYIEWMGAKSCVLKDGREMLLSRASAKDIRKAYQDYLFSRMVDCMDR